MTCQKQVICFPFRLPPDPYSNTGTGASPRGDQRRKIHSLWITLPKPYIGFGTPYIETGSPYIMFGLPYIEFKSAS